jgi:hypothetical protein
LYYKYVKEAEEYYSDIICKTTKPLTNQYIIKMLSLSSKADIFRAESYVSPITVMDVVRGKQDKQYDVIATNPDLCKSEPQKYAPCLIGPYGYIISILENLGYIMRFRLTFCTDKYSAENCKHKINEKYLPRVKFSFEKFDSINTVFDIHQKVQYLKNIQVNQIGGGRHRRSRITKRRRAKRATRRCKKRKHTRAK